MQDKRLQCWHSAPDVLPDDDAARFASDVDVVAATVTPPTAAEADDVLPVEDFFLSRFDVVVVVVDEAVDGFDARLVVDDDDDDDDDE